MVRAAYAKRLLGKADVHEDVRTHIQKLGDEEKLPVSGLLLATSHGLPSADQQWVDASAIRCNELPNPWLCTIPVACIRGEWPAPANAEVPYGYNNSFPETSQLYELRDFFNEVHKLCGMPIDVNASRNAYWWLAAALNHQWTRAPGYELLLFCAPPPCTHPDSREQRSEAPAGPVAERRGMPGVAPSAPRMPRCSQTYFANLETPRFEPRIAPTLKPELGKKTSLEPTEVDFGVCVKNKLGGCPK